MSTSTPEELARAAGEKGTFNFIDRLRGRNYAKEECVVYLDEDLGFKLQRLRDALADENTPVSMHDEIIAGIKAVGEALEESKYTFFIEGISNKRYDELIDIASETFPYEYEEIVDPFSGRKSKVVIPTDERAELFTKLLWVECINRVESATEVDDNINMEFVSAFREEAPLDAIRRVSDAIDKVRMAGEWINYLEDEDFFPRP